jgi:hypothetical protein
MSLRIVLDAPDKLDLAEELQAEYFAQAKEVVAAAADLLLAEIHRLLRLRFGTFLTAAPAGQPPEWDTGQLNASFRRLPARIQGAVASSGIGSQDPGGNRLEYGFTDLRGIRTLPHPFLRPAIAATEGPINELVQARLG